MNTLKKKSTDTCRLQRQKHPPCFQGIMLTCVSTCTDQLIGKDHTHKVLLTYAQLAQLAQLDNFINCLKLPTQQQDLMVIKLVRFSKH